MAKTEKKLPSKRNAAIFTTIFLITQFFYLVTVLGNFPILKDTFDVSGMPRFATFYNEGFIYFDIACTTIQIILFLFVCRAFSNKGYPSLISFIFFFWNIIVCTVYSVWIYLYDTRSMSFQFQLVFLIPIAIIFMTSVFVIEDFADLARGNYEAYVSKPTREAQKKFKQQTVRVQNTVKRTQNNSEASERISYLSAEETLQQHQQKIADAALKTIPDTEKDNITNYDYLKEIK